MMTFAKARVPGFKGGHMARCTSEWALGEICFRWGCREMLCPAVVSSTDCSWTAQARTLLRHLQLVSSG